MPLPHELPTSPTHIAMTPFGIRIAAFASFAAFTHLGAQPIDPADHCGEVKLACVGDSITFVMASLRDGKGVAEVVRFLVEEGGL